MELFGNVIIRLDSMIIVMRLGAPTPEGGGFEIGGGRFNGSKQGAPGSKRSCRFFCLMKKLEIVFWAFTQKT